MEDPIEFHRGKTAELMIENEERAIQSGGMAVLVYMGTFGAVTVQGAGMFKRGIAHVCPKEIAAALLKEGPDQWKDLGSTAKAIAEANRHDEDAERLARKQKRRQAQHEDMIKAREQKGE